MPSYAQKLRKNLRHLIQEMGKEATLFSKRPGHDFTREGKLGFEKTVSILLSLEGKSLNNELLDFFPNAPDLPSAAALVQNRAKLHPDALPTLFHRFATTQKADKLFRGYRLLAADGSTLHIPYNPAAPDTNVVFRENQQPCSLLHLHALYDLSCKTYVDARVEGVRGFNEQKALIQMVKDSQISHAILLADRGYESYNVLAHIQKKGWKFLVRLKDASGIVSGLLLPDHDPFDVSFDLLISCKSSQAAKALYADKNRFKFVPASKFDYSEFDLTQDDFARLQFRIVRFRVSDDLTETVITNLDRDQFPAEDLKALYFRRWGIESSFRKLKYTLGLLHFHAKKVEHIHQETFARLIMYNFFELITSHTIILKKDRQYAYQVNFSVAVHICRRFFRGNVSPPLLETLLSRYILPIRPGRSFPRTPPPRGVVSFTYRVA